MKAMLTAFTAAALIAFGAAASAANAADEPCRGAAVELTDGSTQVVCITFALADKTVADESESVSPEAPQQHELLAKLVLALDERQFQTDFDPTDVGSIEAVAKELGITIDAGDATLAEALAIQGGLGERESLVDLLKDALGKMPGGSDYYLGRATEEELIGGALGDNPIDDGPVDPGSGIGATGGGYTGLVQVDRPGYLEDELGETVAPRPEPEPEPEPESEIWEPERPRPVNEARPEPELLKGDDTGIAMVVQNEDGTVGDAGLDPWIDWDQVIRETLNPGDTDPAPDDGTGAELDAGAVELNLLRAGDGITDYHEDAEALPADASPTNGLGGCYGQAPTGCGELEYHTPEGGESNGPTPQVGGAGEGSDGPTP